MMKKLIAIILSAALTLSVTACESLKTPPESESKHTPRFIHTLPEEEITERIKWLSWYKFDEDSPAAQLYKEQYGAEFVADYTHVTYENRYDVLATMVASDNSPDIFQYEDRFFPYGAFMGLFAPIDDVIDLSGREWDHTRAFIEAHRFGDKNYTAITELVPPTSLLFYYKPTMKKYDFTDPYDLWQANQWTWDEFEQMCEIFGDISAINGGRYGVYGYYIDEAIIATTGTPLIGLKDGRVQNNLDNGNIERAMEVLQKFAIRDYRYPYHGLGNWHSDNRGLVAGRHLFRNDGPWVYEETLQKQIAHDKGDLADFDEIGIVPWPRDPQSLTHYTRGRHESLMLVQGAKNIDGFKALTQCLVIAAHDSKAKEQIREKKKLEHNWTDFQLDTLDKITEMPVVFDFKNGIGTDIADATMASNVENLTKPVIMMGEHYTARREAERAIIEMRINEINKSVR